MQLTDLEKKVYSWSEKSGIHAGSTWQKQIVKWEEEEQEYHDAKNDLEKMDSYGDQVVCLINARDLYRGEFRAMDSRAGVRECIENHDFMGAILAVLDAAKNDGYDPGECMKMAWDEIKDRAGLMVDGLFVKWESLSFTQRLGVAKSGRLKELDSDEALEKLKRVCISPEWDQIVAVSERS